MIYNSVAEIFDTIDRTRGRVYERVESLGAEREALRASAETWSVSEIVEHLAVLEERMAQMITMMLAKAETAAAAASGEEVTGAEQATMEPFTLDHLIERSLGEKYEAPEQIRPRGGLPMAVLLERLRASRRGLRLLQPRLEAVNLSGMTFPHPVFGPLNAYQWLAFIGLHEERHLRQLERLVSSAARESLG